MSNLLKTSARRMTMVATIVISSIASVPIYSAQSALQATDLTVNRRVFSFNEQTGVGVTSPISLTEDKQFNALGVRHRAGRSAQKWMPEVLGGGVVVADFNSDGAVDIFFPNSGALAQTRPDNAADTLLINDGNGDFSNQTEQWGLFGSGYGMGAAVGDYNNDGKVDLLTTSFAGGVRLYENRGDKFVDVSKQRGLEPVAGWSSSAGFADFNSDGYLDIYVARYVDYTVAANLSQYKNGVQIYSAPTLYDGLHDLLYLSEDAEQFVDASAQAGLAAVKGKGLALAIGDIDKDGDQDVYVANDTSANQLWLNDGTGVFKDYAKYYGAAFSKVGRETASMGADFSDVDHNGKLDIAVTNFQGENTSLYSQRKTHSFQEISDATGIGENSRQRLSFGLAFVDLDNDSDEDLIVANGHIDDNIAMSSESVSFEQFNSVYENQQGEYRDVSGSVGGGLYKEQVSRGMATADFNGDGKLDVVIANNNDQPQLLINSAKSAGNYINLWLRGQQSNASAIGAKVIYNLGNDSFEREVMGAQSYLSVSSLRVHLGAGTHTKITNLTVVWPSGVEQSFSDVDTNRFYTLLEGSALEPYTPGAYE